MKIAILIFLSLLFGSCEDKKKTSKKKFRYQIENVSMNNKIKCVATVRIGNIYEKNEIQELSEIIKKEIDCISDHIYISYLQPGMKENAGAWAVVEYNPEFNIEVFGKTTKDFINLKNYEVDNSRTFLGHWIDLGEEGDIVYRIRDSKNRFFLESCSPSEGTCIDRSELFKRQKDGGTIFIDEDNRDEYYVIDPKGNLGVFDNYGWVVTYFKFK